MKFSPLFALTSLPYLMAVGAGLSMFWRYEREAPRIARTRLVVTRAGLSATSRDRAVDVLAYNEACRLRMCLSGGAPLPNSNVICRRAPVLRRCVRARPDTRQQLINKSIHHTCAEGQAIVRWDRSPCRALVLTCYGMASAVKLIGNE